MPKYHVMPAEREWAEKITDRIRKATDELWSLLLQAHEGQAYIKLGYKHWNAYVEGEFDFTRRRSYQLLNQGKVIKLLREAVGTDVHTSGVSISEAEARDVFPVRDVVAQEVREQVQSGVPAQEAVRVAVEAARQPITRTMAEEEPPEMLPVRQVEDCPCHAYVCVHCGDMLGA